MIFNSLTWFLYKDTEQIDKFLRQFFVKDL